MNWINFEEYELFQDFKKNPFKYRNMEESKYYTPELEEFYIGFEFEWFWKIENGIHKGQWKKEEYGEHNLNNYWITKDNIKKEVFRVKYLDIKDLGELGWIGSYDEPEEWFLWQDNYDTYQLYFDDKTRDEAKNQGIGITIYDKDTCDRIFNGYIKNKSELKKLMKQLGII